MPPRGRPAPKAGPVARPAPRKMAEPAPREARTSTRRSIAHRVVPRRQLRPRAPARHRRSASIALRTRTRPASPDSSVTPPGPTRSRAGTSRNQTRRAARDPRPAQRPMQRACRRTSREPPARCKTPRRVTTPRGVAPVCLVLLARRATGPVALGIRAVRAAPPSHRSPARRAPRRTSSVPTAACAASRSGMTSNARTASGSK